MLAEHILYQSLVYISIRRLTLQNVFSYYRMCSLAFYTKALFISLSAGSLLSVDLSLSLPPSLSSLSLSLSLSLFLSPPFSLSLSLTLPLSLSTIHSLYTTTMLAEPHRQGESRGGGGAEGQPEAPHAVQVCEGTHSIVRGHILL